MKGSLSRILVVGVAGLAAAAAVGSAVAGAGSSGGHGMPGHMDLSGDGRVSAAEAEAMRAVRFLRWDADGDGAVTEQEMRDRGRARMDRRMAKRIAMLDGNGDGRIERAGFEAHDAARFAATEADGVVAGEEMRQGMQHDRRGGKDGCRRSE